MDKVKTFLKSLLKVVVFLGIFLAVMLFVMDILRFKQQDGTLPVRNYYDLPEDTVDVLFLGSSHIGMNVSTQVLWDEFGIAGYKCWGSTQPIWNTYFYLKECLKYQTPKVVVVDVHGSIFSYDYADYVLQIKNTMGLRLSRDKIDAVLTSSPKSQWGNMLLELPTYHTRYSELSEEDFQYFPWMHHTDISVLVNQSQDIVFPFDILDKDATEGVEPLAKKEEKYLRAIIELCRERNIPLELISAPYQLSEFEQRRFRAVGELVAEYDGLRFTNYNDIYRECNIDPHQDFLDPGHFNSTGVPKYTRLLADLLNSTYDLPDRREDPDHVWNVDTSIQEEPVYEIDRQFAGDGHQEYLNTEFALFDNPLASWTVFAEFAIPPLEDEDKVIFSCYDEHDDNYSGLLVNVDSNDLLTFRFSSYENIQTDRVRSGDRVWVAIVKNYKTMEVYFNGERLAGMELQNFSNYKGNVLLGCQEAADNSLFRFSRPVIYDLQIYNTAMTESQIQSWKPRVLPEPKQKEFISVDNADESTIYALDYQFNGDGQEHYIDTNVRLYDDPEASWTLLSRIEPQIEHGDTIYYSAFVEDIQNYRGLLIRRPEVDKLNIVFGNNYQVTAEIPPDEPSTLIIVKDRFAYTIYLNGEIVADGINAPCDAHDLTLLIGCENSPDGGLYRFAGTTVYNLEVVSGLMREEDILAWKPEKLEEEPQPVPSPVEYHMGIGLAGNGKDNYVDTGIQLYDVPSKNWAIHMVIDFDENAYGSALSCFAEDPGNYRGLLVRQVDKTTYGITMGSAYGSVTVGSDRVIVMDILKDQYQYRVYINGVKQIEMEGFSKSWDGTLVVGAEKMLNGTPFRFSTQKVRKLDISEILPGEEEIMQNYESELNPMYFQK